MQIESQSTIGKSLVGDHVIQYTIKKDANGNAKELNGHVRVGTETIATFNCNDRGVIGFSISIENELTLAQRKDIVDQLFEDAEEVFGSDEE